MTRSTSVDACIIPSETWLARARREERGHTLALQILLDAFEANIRGCAEYKDTQKGLDVIAETLLLSEDEQDGGDEEPEDEDGEQEEPQEDEAADKVGQDGRRVVAGIGIRLGTEGI